MNPQANPTHSLVHAEAANYFSLTYTPVEFRIMIGQGVMTANPGQPIADGGIAWRMAIASSPHAAKALLRDLTAVIGLYEDKFGTINLPDPDRGEIKKFEPRAVEPAPEPAPELRCRDCDRAVGDYHTPGCASERRGFDPGGMLRVLPVLPADCD